MATANLKEIKRRIKSVESTMQITKAMELVASSKLRRAKEKAERAEPFFNLLYEMMCRIVAESGDFQSTFMQQHTSGATLLIVIAGDRGLAGGFNANVFRQAQIRLDELQAAGREAVVIAIGRKAVEFFQRRSVRLLAEFENIGEDITVYKAMDIADRIVALYQKGDILAVELIFTSYVSPLVQEAHHMHVMPVEHLEHAPAGYHALTTYEPSPEAVFDALIPKYLTGILFCSVIESFAAEQAARRLAMENATDNATEMISDLSLVYNRARQSAITQEITEIVSGANAQS